jgi:hypothetical protein
LKTQFQKAIPTYEKYNLKCNRPQQPMQTRVLQVW